MDNTKIIIGTAQFGLNYGINNKIGKPNSETVKEILDYAINNGINYIDTAEAYGDSHEVIGGYHKLSSPKFNVITKFSSKRIDLPFKLTDRVYKDLHIMNINSLYAYMFHSFNDYKLYIESYKYELIKLKNDGYIKKIGVSLYTNEEVEEILKSDLIDLIQIPFNLLDNNNQRFECLKKMKNKNIEVHCRSVFLQGLFFKNTNELPSFLHKLAPYIDTIHKISKSINTDIYNLSLAYAFHQPYIDKILIGVDSVDQLKQNVLSLSNPISKQVLDQVDEIVVNEIDLLNPSNWNK
jgi:aryl-alcohol dehydrogenase-like predicted oxidoreductase